MGYKMKEQDIKKLQAYLVKLNATKEVKKG